MREWGWILDDKRPTDGAVPFMRWRGWVERRLRRRWTSGFLNADRDGRFTQLRCLCLRLRPNLAGYGVLWCRMYAAGSYWTRTIPGQRA